MFPLGLVLMPGGVLPLHVFEPRYQALVRDCLAGEPEFGVVLITRGHEVGGGDQRCSVGVRVRIVQLADLGEGRLALVCIATDRIRIDRWLPDDPYPMAEVSAWEEPPVDHPLEQGFLDTLATRVRRLAALSLELGDAAGDPSQDLPDDPLLRSYALADLAPLGPVDRQRLLETPDAVARLALLSALLDEVEPGLHFRLGEGSSPSDSPPAW